MDWTEKLEHKKKIRKMAYRMLWADFRELVLSWKVLLLALMYLGFFFLPYFKGLDDFNSAALYYFVIWVFTALTAMPEAAFNYLPLSTKDIIYYLKCRTNHQTAWFVLVSGLTALILDATGVDVFWERGLITLIFLLVTEEWYFFMTLYGYSKPMEISFLDTGIPVGRKVRIAIYNVYSVILLFVCLIVGMFMDYNENAKTKLLVLLCAYLVMYIFRADAVRWVHFNEYNKAPRRNLYNTTAFQNQQ